MEQQKERNKMPTETLPVDTQENKNRVYNLTVELAQMKSNKKAAMRGFTDEVKRLENEIKDILKGDNQLPGVEE